MAPKWESAGEKLKVNPNVALYSVDATANEVPSVKISGFPTIKFYPGNAKDAPVDFDGDRSEEGIIKFLKEKSTHPWVEIKEDL